VGDIVGGKWNHLNVTLSRFWFTLAKQRARYSPVNCNISTISGASGVSKSMDKCSSFRKLVILLLVSSCYCFRDRGIVSVVVLNIIPLKGIKPFM